jgi:hypothetical protein
MRQDSRIHLNRNINILSGAGFSPDKIGHAANEHIRQPLLLQDQHYRL